MTNRYDDIERKLGIAAYASPHEGFAAVVKARYSDFVVHEVDLNGNIARLESLETPPKKSAPKVEIPAETKADVDTKTADDDEETRKRKLSESADQPAPKAIKNENEDKKETETEAKKESETEAKKETETEAKKETETETKEEPAIDWDTKKQDLSKLIGEVPAEEAIAFLQLNESEKGNEVTDRKVQKYYTLPVISDKQIRRSVHFLIKTPAFSSICRADTQDGKIQIWHKRFEAYMPVDTFTGGGAGDRNNNRNNSRNNKNDKGGKRGGDRGGNKKNQAPWPADRPDFLRFVLYKENIDTGTAAKDVTRYGHLNPKRGINYAGMKDKRGITSQFCSVYRVEKERLLAVNAGRGGADNGNDAAAAAGGGNTSTRGSAIIKVGNFSYGSKEVRLGALNGNRFDIVLRNIDVGEVPDGSSKLQLVQQKLETAGKAFKEHGFINFFGMQRFGKSNDTHEVGIAVLKGDFEGATDIIMREKTDEKPFIQESRQKWANRFESIDVSKDANAARQAEVKCARAIQRDMGRFMLCEKSIVTTLSRKPMDYKRAFGSIAKNMRSMFLHAYQSYLFNMVASRRIETGGSTGVIVGDLVLVEDKPSGEGGGGTSGLKGKAVKMLMEEDVKDGKYSITDVVLPLAGTRIRYPGGPTGDLYEELMKKDGIKKSDFARIANIDREISLGGDYRKLMCKPSDVSFEVKAYTDPVQPLLQTDLMKVNGVDVTATTLCTSQEEENKDATDSGDKLNSDADEDTIFGFVVGFSLPPSAYATIALRELTKRPTSSDYQSKLELSGKCERNLLESDVVME